MERHPREKACTHPDLRPAIGPESGILCGRCGQDVPTPAALARVLSEITQIRDANVRLRRALLSRTHADECTRCGAIDAPEKMFKGLQTEGYRVCCVDCLTHWFDDDAGDEADMRQSELARYFERLGISVGADRYPALALRAHQMFPKLAGIMSKQAR